MEKPKIFPLIWWWPAMPPNRRPPATVWLFACMCLVHLPEGWSQSVEPPAVQEQTESVRESNLAKQPEPDDRSSDDAGQKDADASSAYHNVLVRGRVVYLAEALNKQFGITTVPEVAENCLAIVTPDGSLTPIVENLRGRAFRKDPQLREMELELLVRQYAKQPFVQIVKIFEVEGDRRLEVDYWCDVCAIIMFEKGPCACCQDDNRLRKRPVDPVRLPSAN
jgi:hypothetical protein